MHKKVILIIVLSIAGFLLAACGGGGNSGDIEVTVGDDFQYSPSTLTVSAGQEITLTFHNEASVEHTFNILAAGEDLDVLLGGSTGEAEEEHSDDDEHADDEDEHADAGDGAAEEELHAAVFFEMHAVTAGESITATITAPAESGDYVFFCSLPGHAEAGMVGTLTVQP